jgi:hypothetical protein
MRFWPAKKFLDIEPLTSGEPSMNRRYPADGDFAPPAAATTER